MRLQVADGFACGTVNFERADHSALIVCVKFVSGQRVDQFESFSERIQPMGFDFMFDLPSKFPIGRWTLKDPAKQTFEVERSSAHEENGFSLCAEFVDLLVGEIAILRNAEGVGRRNQIEKVMGNSRLIRLSRFRGPNGLSLIHISEPTRP